MRTTGVAAAAALASTVLLASPAMAAPPAPDFLGNYLSVGSLEDTSSLDMGSYVLYSAATDGGIELWRTSGTEASSIPVKDINPSGSSTPRELTKAGSTAFFVATSGDGRELWKTNGNPDGLGTVQVEDIINGAGGPAISDIEAISTTKVVFSADVDASGGKELWISDGTEAGTTLLKDINPSGDSSPHNMTEVDGVVYFAANDGTNGTELWKTDGTGAGTVLVENINSGSSSSAPSDLMASGDQLFFSAVDGDGREIWASEGTAATTSQLRDLFFGNASGSPTRFTAVTGGTVFFAATSGAAGEELWKTDGTPGGTSFVKDILPGVQSSNPNHMIAFGSKVLFAADNSGTNTELWSSDGSADGTVRVKEIRPGSAQGSSPQNMAAVGGRVVFKANDGQHGQELWVTDGTSSHTALVSDLAPGSADSTPVQVGKTAADVIFRTFVEESDSGKLWALQGSSLTVVDAGTPSISGTRTVGKTLTASTGTWEAGVTFKYQWFRDSSPIPGATSSKYTLTGHSFGKRINVRVTGAKGNEVSGVASSSTTNPVAAGTLSLKPKPTITGTKKVWSTLTAHVGTVNSGVTKSYQWLRDGHTINTADAKTSTYKLQPADKGKGMQVKVKLVKLGYKTVYVTSSKTSDVK